MLLKEPSFIIQKLIILLSSSVKSNKIRIVTVSLATDVLLELSPTLSEPERATVEDFRSENMATLQTSFKAEDMFLELFEDEFQQKVAMTTKTSFDQLLGDSSMLLPPVASPLSGIALEKRRPCGETGTCTYPGLFLQLFHLFEPFFHFRTNPTQHENLLCATRIVLEAAKPR